MNEDQATYTVKEAAKLLNLSDKGVRAAIWDGRIKPIKELVNVRHKVRMTR